MARVAKQKPEVTIPDSPEAVFPDKDDLEVFRRLEQMLRKHPARLIGPEGQMMEIPAKMYTTMVQFAHLLATNNVVLVTPMSKDLTTQEAAIHLGVSRPTLVKLLDEGKIPYTRPGKHRRVRLADVNAYRETVYADQDRALDELTQMSEETGGYDLTPEEIAAFRAA